MIDTVLFAANRGYALTSSRKAMIQRFLSAGWQVVLATADDRESRQLVKLGSYLEPLGFNRGGVAVGQDLRSYWRMRSVYNTWRPKLAHHFHAKPVIFGTLAARQVMGNSVRVVNTITGLGNAFVNSGITVQLAKIGYRAALSRADMTVFQNSDDRALFLEQGWLPEERTRLITGSGIDIDNFYFVGRAGRPGDVPVVVMLARLLRQKGILEFIEVARRIRLRWAKARFLLAGEEDPGHHDAVTAEWLYRQDVVEYLGRLANVGPVLAAADLFLFPSYYREGVPRAVMEAAATGLPTVGFDVPGVREAVRDGKTGYLVPYRDVDALSERVSELLEDCEHRLAMGMAARRLAEEAFDIRAIHGQYLDLYREWGIAI